MIENEYDSLVALLCSQTLALVRVADPHRSNRGQLPLQSLKFFIRVAQIDPRKVFDEMPQWGKLEGLRAAKP